MKRDVDVYTKSSVYIGLAEKLNMVDNIALQSVLRA